MATDGADSDAIQGGSDAFYQNPILNSPYSAPTRHWELDADDHPTDAIVEGRRGASFVTPVPAVSSARRDATQAGMIFPDTMGLSTDLQQYDPNAYINEIRRRVDVWRQLPNPNDWGVTYVTRQLLQHWRSGKFDRYRPFFCQVEAIETIIWLTEVAPRRNDPLLEHLRQVSEVANPELERWALKMATGSGKTTVMAMLIAWQALNAVENPNLTQFTRYFLVVTPGITIKNRLQVLLPNHTESYYASRQLVPPQMLRRLNEAKIVITNYHALQPRERWKLSKAARDTLRGRSGTELNTRESYPRMMQRVMPLIMDERRGVMVLNDEGHHCYRGNIGDSVESKLTGDDSSEAKSNTEAARVWLTGLEEINKRVPIKRVIDLSATPFFLRGSGYAEGTLFPWTVSDFSLMDAIECGIVKLPRVPVDDDTPLDSPVYRDLWKNVQRDVKAATKGGANAPLHPERLPVLLQTAISMLYRHYEEVDDAWDAAGIEVPPCFIIVCNNTRTSKLVYDYVAGKGVIDDAGELVESYRARCDLFSNFDGAGKPLARPNTILIDSRQLESGEALSKEFKQAATDEIESFRQQVATTSVPVAAENLSDADILREVVNTVGKPGQLGANVRCVVSVSMLTEGWDANTVTHILGVRAFGTQLLCEQVVGRALRRLNYDIDDDGGGMFLAEYAQVYGVPFNFTAGPTVSPPEPPKPSTHVHAVRERGHLEIQFPRVIGYYVRRDRRETLRADFTRDSEYRFAPVIPEEVDVRGVAGEPLTLTYDDLRLTRRQTVEYHLTNHLANRYWAAVNSEDGGTAGNFDYRNFMQLKRIVSEWIDEYLVIADDSPLGALMHHEFTERACQRIIAAIDRTAPEVDGDELARVIPQLESWSRTGTTTSVDVVTTKEVYETDASKCHVNYVALDSGWEAGMARTIEQHPLVIAYVKNHGLGLEIPYADAEERRTYLPDFVVQVDCDDGGEPLNLLIEVKGERRETDADKSAAAETYWCRAVNNDGRYGRWAYVYCDDPKEFRSELDAAIREHCGATVMA